MFFFRRDHIPPPYLICFACDSLLKRDWNQKAKLELVDLDLVLLARMCVAQHSGIWSLFLPFIPCHMNLQNMLED